MIFAALAAVLLSAIMLGWGTFVIQLGRRAGGPPWVVRLAWILGVFAYALVIFLSL